MESKVLSIAGSDSSGGAGIQADLKAFSAFGVYGMTVITAVTAQNTRAVTDIYPISAQSVEKQLQAIFDDIVPGAIKVGMLCNKEIIEVVGKFLAVNAQHIPIVLDPVMVSKSGYRLLQPDAVHALKTSLLPLATVITPNLPEACDLIGIKTELNRGGMLQIAKNLLEMGPRAVLLKGGHLDGDSSVDLFVDCEGRLEWLEAERVKSKNTHGTGCTLSSAIASAIALHRDTLQACQISKRYIHAAITAAANKSVGGGNGPVHHFYHVWPTIDKI